MNIQGIEQKLVQLAISSVDPKPLLRMVSEVNRSSFSDEQVNLLIRSVIEQIPPVNKMPVLSALEAGFQDREGSVVQERLKTEYLKIIAAENGRKASCEIQSSGIKDPGARLEIARVAAKNSRYGLDRYVRNFRIESQEERVKLAKIAAQYNPWELCQFIQQYEIDDPKDRIEIAKIAAIYDGESVSEFIGEFRIENEEDRIEIATIAAAHDGEGVSEYIENYDISSEADRSKIAAIAAAQNGVGFLKYLHNWKIGDQKRLFKIQSIVVAQSPQSLNQLERIKNTPEAPEHLKMEHAAVSFVLKHCLGKEREDPLARSLMQMRSPLARRAALQLIAKNADALNDRDLKQPIEIISSLIKDFNFNRTALKNDQLQQQLLFTSHAMLASGLSAEVVGSIFKKFEAGKSSETKIKILQKISALIDLGYHDAIGEDIDQSLETAVKESFRVETVADLGEKYSRTFGELRDPSALVVYYSRIKTLEDEVLIKDFQTYFTEVLEGTFSQNRYAGLTLPKGWTEGAKRTVEITSSGVTLNFKALLKMKFDDGHVPQNVVEAVTPYLDNPKKGLEETLSSLEKELILLAREGRAHLEPLQRALRGTGYELENDVKGWLGIPGQETKRSTTYQLSDTDNWGDFLLMGTEVPGSCQRVDGDPRLNQGLLGTMLSGANRVLIMRDASGKSVGRALLRLMEKEGEQVLFLERIYPQTVGESERAALIDFAKERSASLKLPLYTLEISEKPEEGELTSLPGRGKVQYVDGAGGLQRGSFTIKHFQRLNVGEASGL